MFTKPSKITNTRENLSNYIDGIDIYNSTLLTLLKDPSLEKVEYIITTYEYRPDLISLDFYKSEAYMGLLMLQAARGLETLTKGSTLYLIPKNLLDSILNNL